MSEATCHDLFESVPASEQDLAHAALHYGACHEVARNEDAGLMVCEFPLALVVHWSIGPQDRTDPESTWCHPGCTEFEHLCPTSPQEARGSTEDPSPLTDCGDGRLIAHYAAALTQGGVEGWPPIIVIDNRVNCAEGTPLSEQWLVEDGYHRISAALMLGWATFPAVVLAADEQW